MNKIEIDLVINSFSDSRSNLIFERKDYCLIRLKEGSQS